MQSILEINYPEIPVGLRERYATMLVNRAVRHYIEGTLDKIVVDEDLADGRRDAGFFALEDGKTDLCNLTYNEQEEQKYQDSLLEMLSEIRESQDV